MEFLPGGIGLNIPDGCFPLTTDSILLAHFVGGGQSVLDLGSGCGTLGIMLCSRDPNCHVVGVELDTDAHSAALDNILRNRLSHRMESICGDIREVPGLFAAGSFSCCISNPPYFSDGPASANRLARREDACPLSSLIQAADWALKYGGDFYLVHRPERLAEIIALGAARHLEAKKLILVRHREGSGVNLILLQLRKGAKPGLLIDDWILHHRDGSPTKLYHEIYRSSE